MIKRLFTSLLIFLLFASNVSATTITGPYYNNNQNPVFGHDHSYSVTFRGNGEAVVNLRVLLTNTSDYPIDSYELRIPEGITISNIQAFQAVKER